MERMNCSDVLPRAPRHVRRGGQVSNVSLHVMTRLHEPGWARHFVVKNIVVPWVASRASMLYLAARTRNRVAVCLHVAHTVSTT